MLTFDLKLNVLRKTCLPKDGTQTALPTPSDAIHVIANRFIDFRVDCLYNCVANQNKLFRRCFEAFLKIITKSRVYVC